MNFFFFFFLNSALYEMALNRYYWRRYSSERALPPSTQIKLDVKKLWSQRNQWHDESVAPPLRLRTTITNVRCSLSQRVPLWETTGSGEGKRDALSDARRGSSKSMNMWKSSCTEVGTMLKIFSKTSSVWRKVSSTERLSGDRCARGAKAKNKFFQGDPKISLFLPKCL